MPASKLKLDQRHVLGLEAALALLNSNITGLQLHRHLSDLVDEARNTAAPEKDKSDFYGLAVPDECPHMIVFDDTEMTPLVFAGADSRSAALRTWARVSQQWNAHMFVRIDRNCRDDRYPNASVIASAVDVDEWPAATDANKIICPHEPSRGEPFGPDICSICGVEL